VKTKENDSRSGGNNNVKTVESGSREVRRKCERMMASYMRKGMTEVGAFKKLEEYFENKKPRFIR